MVYDEDANGANHGQGLKHPEQPLGAEGIAIHALGKLANTIDAPNLVLSETQRLCTRQVVFFLTMIRTLEMYTDRTTCCQPVGASGLAILLAKT